jgi:hypothetical protein
MDAAASAVSQPMRRRSILWTWFPWTAATITAGLAGRIAWIAAFADPDADGQGHYRIARALLVEPARLSLHWVWLPGYHYALWALLHLGAGYSAIRLMSAILASLLALLTFVYEKSPCCAEATTAQARDRSWMACGLCAVAPILNVLGVSAQQEILFSVVILLTALAMDQQRWILTGALLAAACMIRYEAWGAVLVMLALRTVGASSWAYARMPRFVRPACRLSVWVVSLPLLAIMGWVVLHRVVDGEAFGFLRELYRFTRGQRQVLGGGSWTDALWFPVLLPLYLFGPAAVLVPIGIRSAWRPSFLLPSAMYAFLLASHAAKGSLGSGRYYAAITPFVCICVAHGVTRLTQRWPRAVGNALAGGVMLSLVILTWLNLRWAIPALAR